LHQPFANEEEEGEVHFHQIHEEKEVEGRPVLDYSLIEAKEEVRHYYWIYAKEEGQDSYLYTVILLWKEQFLLTDPLHDFL
jgi:hypothetical protein